MKLLPCPFCGAYGDDLRVGQNYENADFCVSCDNCESTGKPFSGFFGEAPLPDWNPERAQEHAIEAWNRRYPGKGALTPLGEGMQKKINVLTDALKNYTEGRNTAEAMEQARAALSAPSTDEA